MIYYKTSIDVWSRDNDQVTEIHLLTFERNILCKMYGPMYGKVYGKYVISIHYTYSLWNYKIYEINKVCVDRIFDENNEGSNTEGSFDNAAE